MSTPISIAAGQWLRFDRYEVRNDCIAPVPGAKRRVYDPWKPRDRPYDALAALVQDSEVLNFPAERPDLVRGILDWCHRYGLLGTLFHRIVMVTLWPRWDRMELADGKKVDVFVPRQDSYVRQTGGWLINSHVFGEPTRNAQIGAPLAVKELPSNARAAVALVTEVDHSLIKEEPLDGMWYRHFPDVPYGDRETYAYPGLGSREFWSLYGEPISEFAYAAWLLTNALEAITHPKGPDAPRLGAERLTQLAAISAPRLVPGPSDGALQQQWVPGSLLSSLALMAMDDIAAHVLYRCETCGRLFRSDAYQAKYCSPTCRHTMQKREYRKRKRREERRHLKRPHDTRQKGR